MKRSLHLVFLNCLMSMTLYAGQSLSDLQEVDDNHTDQKIALVVQSVYGVTQESFHKEIDLFTDNLSKIIENLGEYSDQGVQEFNARCDKELKDATGRINIISTHALNNYYDGLKKNGVATGVGVTDPVAQKLQAQVNTL